MLGGPWSFDRNFLILERVSGEEQPSDLEINFSTFWVHIYDLPLKLRSTVVAKQLGNIIGKFEEMDSKVENIMGKFLRLKVRIDLRKPLKRGTIINYQDRNLKVFAKYERLPTFCFACGKIGNQLKDCEDLGENITEGYDEIKERDLSFGPWLRASQLPRNIEEPKKENNAGSCSRNLFDSPSNSRGSARRWRVWRNR